MMGLARHYLLRLMHCFDERGGCTMRRDDAEVLPFNPGQHTELRLAQSDGPFQHRDEHGREVAGRGIDDLQNLGDGTLSR
jgi:hypothetical protein